MNKPPRRNELLREARRERNWTQRRLADELHVGKQTVQSWELGTRNPSLELRLRLCDLLSKTPEQLGFQLDSKDEQISEQVSSSLMPLTHGIRNEILEEFAKKKEMCHLKGKKTRPFPVIRRHYE